jgi:hypothetical protein
MREKTVKIATSCLLAVITLVLSLMGGWWVFIALGLLYLGAFGYCSDSFGCKSSPRIARLLLAVFVILSIGQMILSYSSESEAMRVKAVLAKSLTQKQSFAFRPPVAPNGRSLFMSAWHSCEMRDRFNSSRAYGMYGTALNMGAGWLDNPSLPSYHSQSPLLENFFVDVAEVVVIEWLRSPLGLEWPFHNTETNGVPHASTNVLTVPMPASRVLLRDFPDNKFITYLAGPPSHPMFLNVAYSGVDYSVRMPPVRRIASASTAGDPRRSLMIEGPGYSVLVTIQHDGRSKFPRAKQFGLAEEIDGEAIPYIMTEDFTITILVRYAEPGANGLSDDTELLVADLVTRFRRDFDWEVFKYNLALRQDQTTP